MADDGSDPTDLTIYPNAPSPSSAAATSSPSISPQDRDIAIRTMIGEEPTSAGQAGVASTMLNRVKAGSYGGKSLSGVALAPGQFEAWSRNPNGLLNIPTTDPRYQQAAAIFDGIASGAIPDLTGGATHFYAPVAQAALGRKPPAWAAGLTGTPLGKTLFFAPPPSESSAPAVKAIKAATSGKAVADPWAPDPKGPNPLSSLYSSSGNAPAASSTPAAPDGWAPDPAGPNPLDALYAAPEAAPTAPAAAVQPGPLAGASSIANSSATGFMNGIPIVGPYVNEGLDKAEAAIMSLASDKPYSEALKTVHAREAGDVAAHPTANLLGGVAGGVAGTAPLVAAAPEAFGLGAASWPIRAGNAFLSGGVLGGADSAVRSDGNIGAIERGAAFGAGTGVGGSIAGNVLGAVGGKALNLLSGTTPAARNVANVLSDIGKTPRQAAADLARMGPNATLADIDPALTDEAGGLASRGGAPTSILKNAMAARASGADDRMSQIVNDALGPKPNAQQILNDIRTRAASNTVDPSTARAALDTSMGPAADPHAVLQNMLETRSSAAAPLYQKALANKVPYDEQLNSFVFNNPKAQTGLQRGIALQRDAAYTEALKTGQPTTFSPNDYTFENGVIRGEGGRFEPAELQYTMPNMKTMQAIKEGLDAMVEDARDPITGRLSKDGVSTAQMRDAFVKRLDQINPDYAAARQAWAGPTQTQEAFNRGLNIFRSQTGSSGVNTTPGALDSWFKGASQGEQDAAKLGARTAFQQQMASASDPASKAAALAGKQVNQQKLASVLGPTEAGNLTKQLTFKYEDPVGEAFSKGLGVFQNRTGLQGIEDTPDALNSWLKTASPAEIEAHQQGARQAIEQALTSARQGDVSAARSLFAKSTANREKLEAVFPKAGKMLDGLDNELKMRATEGKVAAGSDTAARNAIQKKYGPQNDTGGIGAAAPILGEAIGGGAGAAALTGARMLYGSLQNAFSERARNLLTEGTARGLASTGPEQQQFINQLTGAVKSRAAHAAIGAGSQAIGYAGGQYVRNRLSGAVQ